MTTELRNTIIRRNARAAMALASAIMMTALTATAATPATAGDAHTIGDLSITNVWARPSLGNVPNSAAYLIITNGGTADDMLVAAATDVAETVELHTHIMDGTVMRMRKVDGGIPVPAGKTVTFEPGGLHIMMIGLKEKLEAGAEIPLRLTFTTAGETQVDAKIQMSADGKSGARGSHSGTTSRGSHSGSEATN